MTEPPDRTPVTASPVTVRGTSAPGNTVDVSATNIDADSANTIITTTAAADGSWSAEVPVEGGTIALDVVATSPQGATAHIQRTVVFDVTPGAVLLGSPPVRPGAG